MSYLRLNFIYNIVYFILENAQYRFHNINLYKVNFICAIDINLPTNLNFICNMKH